MYEYCDSCNVQTLYNLFLVVFSCFSCNTPLNCYIVARYTAYNKCSILSYLIVVGRLAKGHPGRYSAASFNGMNDSCKQASETYSSIIIKHYYGYTEKYSVDICQNQYRAEEHVI